jgi:hypothetical protein
MNWSSDLKTVLITDSPSGICEEVEKRHLEQDGFNIILIESGATSSSVNSDRIIMSRLSGWELESRLFGS